MAIGIERRGAARSGWRRTGYLVAIGVFATLLVCTVHLGGGGTPRSGAIDLLGHLAGLVFG